ncbi:MAG: glycosyl transferase [Candidatus Zambryskibacteria bacterium]|nr:glycosyl transferase [Candidatus Zambryskibacteria bacterium]
MYLSLKDHCPNFILYTVAFNDECYDILSKLKLPNMVVISMKEFEDTELLKIKPTRSGREYFWTCSSSSILYCIKKYNLDMCTYIDADLIFFENPKVILDEIGDKSILLTEHRLPKGGKKEEMNGLYCVQFMPFKNDKNGITALTWWRERCLEWCYDRYEDGKLGDQKYLDDWATRFPGVHVMKHLGGGVAPWNMYMYKILDDNGKLFVEEIQTLNKYPLVFYHFQSTQIYNLYKQIIAVYWPYDSNIDDKTIKIYQSYGKYLYSSFELIRSIHPNFNLGFNKPINYYKYLFNKIKRKAKKLIAR